MHIQIYVLDVLDRRVVEEVIWRRSRDRCHLSSSLGVFVLVEYF